MSQNSVDFSADPNGTVLLDTLLTNQKQNILTNNSGSSRPTYVLAGTHWINTTTNPWVVNYYDGSSDVKIGEINTSTHIFTPYFGDGSAATPSMTFDSDKDTGLYRIGTNILGIATNGVERVRIDASGDMTLQNYLNANLGIRANTVAVNGFGVRVTQPSSGTTDAILQFTDYAQTTQRASIQGTNDGDLTLNPSSGRDILCVTRFAPNSTLGIKGTTTNDSAQAGSVGEYKSSFLTSGSAVNIATATATNLTSLSLEAGDWDVFGEVRVIVPNTKVMSLFYASSSTVSATTNADVAGFASWIGSFTGDGSTILSIPLPLKRVSIASTTTVYACVYHNANATSPFYGGIYARRVR